MENEEIKLELFCILITMIKLVLWLIILASACAHKNNQELKVTLVTGLWNVNRGDLLIFKRSFDYYLNYFRDTLLVKSNIIFFGDEQLKKFVESNRKYQGNSHFIQKDLNDISKYWYTDKIGKVIDNVKESWLKWQRYSILPQYGLRMYNPVVMSKLRFLAEASMNDPFNSDYYVWIDGAITHNMPPSVLSQGSFVDFLRNYQLDFFIQTGASLPFHPFEVGFKNDGRQYAQITTKSRYYVWGNFLGGKATAATTAYNIYENFLRITLQNMEMNTDEAIFLLMLERYDFLFNRIVDPDAQTLLKTIKINSSVVDERYNLRVINATDVIAYSELLVQDSQPCIDVAPLNLYYDMKSTKYYDLVKRAFQLSLKTRAGILAIFILIGLMFKLTKKERNTFQQLTSQEIE